MPANASPNAACVAVLVLAAGCSQPPSSREADPVGPTGAAGFPRGTLVDLSHVYDRTTVFWPTAESFRLDKVADGVTPDGYYYAANNFATSEHGGTHLDAPLHFSQGGQSVDQIPLERLFGEAYVVDAVDQSSKDPDHQVSLDDIRRAEEAQGPIPADAIVLLRTGFSQR